MKKYILNKQVRLKHDEAYDKFYAFCIDTGDHFILNKTGFTIMNYLKKGKSLEEIVTMLKGNMIMGEKSVLADTIQFLELSEKNGIIAYM